MLLRKIAMTLAFSVFAYTRQAKRTAQYALSAIMYSRAIQRDRRQPVRLHKPAQNALMKLPRLCRTISEQARITVLTNVRTRDVLRLHNVTQEQQAQPVQPVIIEHRVTSVRLPAAVTEIQETPIRKRHRLQYSKSRESPI